MLSTEPAQTIAIRKIRHRDKDGVGIFLPWHPEIIRYVRRHHDRAYSASLLCCYILYAITHDESRLSLSTVYKTEFPSFLLEQTNSGPIANPTAEDVHTGISSPVEELSVHTTINGKPEAVDFQDIGRNGLQINVSDRKFLVRLQDDTYDVNFLRSLTISYWNATFRNLEVLGCIEKLNSTAGPTRNVTLHTLCHNLVSYLQDNGTNVRYSKEFSGHKDIKGTLICSLITNRCLLSIQSSLDQLKLGDRFDKYLKA